jgi:predicted TIM-barrel fold metal-dependent hydrolase
MSCRVLDAHVHCRADSVATLLRVMDAAEVERAVILSWPGEAERLLDAAMEQGGDRLRVALAPDLELVGSDGWEIEIKRFERLIAHAAGLKFYKDAGLGAPNRLGRRLDFLMPELQPFWSLALRHGKPVVLHCGDPADFWGEGTGLRARQLADHPEWRHSQRPDVQGRRWIMNRRAELMRAWPGVTFVGAHLGGFPATTGEMEECLAYGPVDTSVALEEVLTLDRSPVEALILAHSRSICWGSDVMVGPARDRREIGLIKMCAKFVRDSLRLLTSRERVPAPSPIDCPWTAAGLGLGGAAAERVLWDNAVGLYWGEVDGSRAHS